MKIFFTFLLLVIASSLYGTDWKPGDPLVDDRDGQSYKTIQIGNQIWMAENLSYGNMIPTTKAGYEMSDNQIIEKYCWDNDLGNCDGSDGKLKRGGFYEWQEAMQYWNGQPQLPVQGICPKGWHIPSNAEWNTLFNSQGGANCYTNLVAGGASGFEGLMTGYRCTMTGSFRTAATTSDTRTYFWSSEQTDAENAPIIELGLNSIQAFSFRKSVGLCIRCIMDETSSDVNENIDYGFEVYPNPASDYLQISGKPGKIEIFNNLGEKVLEESAYENQQINISNLNPGLYILKNKNGYKKFIKL